MNLILHCLSSLTDINDDNYIICFVNLGNLGF